MPQHPDPKKWFEEVRVDDDVTCETILADVEEGLFSQVQILLTCYPHCATWRTILSTMPPALLSSFVLCVTACQYENGL